MIVRCEGCGVDIPVPTKKFAKRKCKQYKIVLCKSCGAKNFMHILQRFSEK